MIRDTILNFRRRLQGRSFAYQRCFEAKSPYTFEVLADLAKFCRAHEPTFHKDARLHAMLEGRREVWLRIQEYLELDIEEIYRLHKIKEIYPDEEKA